MSIATRFVRLWKADLHGVMESIEDKDLLLKQCLREMQDELESREAALNTLVKIKEKAGQEQKNLQQENTKVEKDLEAAVGMAKDDIARFLIKKRLLLSRHLQELASHIQGLEQDIVNAREAAAVHRSQYEQIQLRAAEFFRSADNKEWDQVFSEIIPATTLQEPSDEEVELELLKIKNSLKGAEKEVDHA